jgi:hypothetical protein
MQTDAENAARAAGFEANNFNLDVFAFSNSNAFPFGGLANIGGKGAWLNGYFEFRVSAHELGHNYGLKHANRWLTRDGTVIGAGNNDEYGDGFDLMGSGSTVSTHFNAFYKRRLDWLTDSNIQTVTANGIYRVFMHDSAAPGGMRVLKIRKNPTKTYWVEFRQLLTNNQFAMNGAMIRWTFAPDFDQTQLLDMAPNTATANDSAAFDRSEFS